MEINISNKNKYDEVIIVDSAYDVIKNIKEKKDSKFSELVKIDYKNNSFLESGKYNLYKINKNNIYISVFPRYIKNKKYVSSFDTSINYSSINYYSYTFDLNKILMYKCEIKNGQVNISNEKCQVIHPVARTNTHSVCFPDSDNIVSFGNVSIIEQNAMGSSMKPSMDTMVLCKAIFIHSINNKFNKILEIGAGSGFVSKFFATIANFDNKLIVDMNELDGTAIAYIKSNKFGYIERLDKKQVTYNIITESALTYLKNNIDYDIVYSNPPYVPFPQEIDNEIIYTPLKPNFSMGIKLIESIINYTYEKPNRSSLVLITSVTLKSLYIQKILKEKQYDVIFNHEGVFKTWFVVSSVQPSDIWKYNSISNSGNSYDILKLGNYNFKVGLCNIPENKDFKDIYKKYNDSKWQYMYCILFKN